MSRPKPQVILTFTDPKTYKTEQVLKASAVYAVFHDGQPINIRSLNAAVDYPGPKYRKSSFGNPGHAHNLAEKLNRLFRTTSFEVFKLTEGVRVEENADD